MTQPDPPEDRERKSSGGGTLRSVLVSLGVVIAFLAAGILLLAGICGL